MWCVTQKRTESMNVCARAKTKFNLSCSFVLRKVVYYMLHIHLALLSLFFNSFIVLIWPLFVSFYLAVCCWSIAAYFFTYLWWHDCNGPNAVSLVVYTGVLSMSGGEIISRPWASAGECIYGVCSGKFQQDTFTVDKT